MTKGFTLVEVIIAAALGLVIGSFLVSILVNQNGLLYKQNSIIDEGLSLNDAIRQIDGNIREAVSVEASYPAESPQFTAGSDVLVLKLPALDSSGVISNAYDYVVVVKDSSRPKILRLQTFPDPQSSRNASNIVLTTILETAQFNYLDKNGNGVTPALAESVSVTLEVLSKTGSIGSNRSATSVTTLRNYGI